MSGNSNASKPKSAREAERILRDLGYSRAEAKRMSSAFRAEPDKPEPTEQWDGNMKTAALFGIKRWARDHAQAIEAKTAPRHQLLAARAAIVDGLGKALDDDVDNLDTLGTLAKAACDEIDQQIRAKRARLDDAVLTARPSADQESPGMGMAQVSGAATKAAPIFRDANTGQIIKAFKHNEPMAAANSFAGTPDYGIGDVIKAMVTGNWSKLPSQLKASGMGVGLGTGGGFLVAPELSSMIVDLARARARVLEAGALSLPMGGHPTLTLATVLNDPTPAWKAENAPFAAQTGTYGQLILSAKTLGCVVPISLELVMSAANLNQVVTAQLTKRMALVLDQAAISGDGTQNTPTGIINQKNVGSVPVNTTLVSATAYSWWSKAVGQCLAANAQLEDLSILYNSDVSKDLDMLQDTLNQPLRPPPNFASIKDRGKVFIANGIVTSGTPAATYSVVGDFSAMCIAFQTQMVLEVSREGSYIASDGSQGNAFGQGQVLIRAYLMADVGLLHQNFFSQISGVQIT